MALLKQTFFLLKTLLFFSASWIVFFSTILNKSNLYDEIGRHTFPFFSLTYLLTYITLTFFSLTYLLIYLISEFTIFLSFFYSYF
jgi:hypothetical protein